MANSMARYRWCDGHYADVECAYAEFEGYLVLSCNVKKGATKLLVAQVIEGAPPPGTTTVLVT
jgi:hypothetical protein